jgi:antitoxin (DNA-binding transcriptional repressor) of toxin-antitoxin stability system
MKRMSLRTFSVRCLAVFERMQKTREPVLITRDGRPIAKLVPVDRVPRQFLGRLEGVVRIVGDIESPVEPPEAWNAMR